MLKRLLLSTALIAASVLSASALELECGAPRTLVGEDANDTNPVARIAVGYSYDDHAWRVFHQLRNGAVVSRQTQYGMTDVSNSAKTQWQGRLLRQPWLFMIGEVRTFDGGYVYHEWMYDSKQGNRLVMQAIARCTARAPALPTPTSQAPTQPFAQATTSLQPNRVPTTEERSQPQAPLQKPPAPQAALPTKDSVPITVAANGHVHVNVLIGGQLIRMVVDTGATASTIPTGFASMLLRDGKATVIGLIDVTYADGRKGQERLLRVNELRLGAHVIRDFKASVSEGTPLLGIDIINSIGPFTIDTRAGELIWHTNRG